MRGLCAGFPKLYVLGPNVRLLFRQASRGMSPVTIGAAEHDILFGLVHRLDALMALQTTDTLSVRLHLRLIDPISRRQRRARDCRSCSRNRRRRTVAFFRNAKPQPPNPQATPKYKP